VGLLAVEVLFDGVSEVHEWSDHEAKVVVVQLINVKFMSTCRQLSRLLIHATRILSLLTFKTHDWHLNNRVIDVRPTLKEFNLFGLLVQPDRSPIEVNCEAWAFIGLDDIDVIKQDLLAEFLKAIDEEERHRRSTLDIDYSRIDMAEITHHMQNGLKLSERHIHLGRDFELLAFDLHLD